jgi:hypothetical protein
MRLMQAVRAWGRPEFREVLKAEVEGLGVDELPLRQALRSGNFVIDARPRVMVNGVDERGDAIIARLGLFFAGIDAGSCCSEDPTAVEPHPEYCELELEIDRVTGETRVSLLDT